MGGGQCTECQKKNIGVSGRLLQTKLAISEPGDAYEQEADRVAEQVMRMSPVDVSKRQKIGMTQPLVQRRASSSATGLAEAPSSVNDVLNSPGQPLDADTRAFFEPRFDHDFSTVRVHSDMKAMESSRAVNATAYTVGNDVVFKRGAYQPSSLAGMHLLAHELTHVVQQSANTDNAHNGLVTTHITAPVIARSVDQWLMGSVDIRTYSYTELVGEIDELSQWLERQTASSEDTVRVEEAVRELRAEVNRRDTSAAGPRTRTRRRGRRDLPTAPGASAEPLPSRYPRVLTEMTSVAYEDPSEMRVEYDLIMQWLARSEISEAERRILIIERDNLAPQLTTDRQRVVAERHAERVRLALTPAESGSANELVERTRIILGIVSDEESPAIAYIYHRGERVTISTEQVQTLQRALRDQLLSASRRIESRITTAWGRYTAQVEINDDHPIISSIAGFIGGVDDPGADLLISYQTCLTRVQRMQQLISTGSLLDAAQLIPRAEAVSREVSQMAARYYEGYIEGAEGTVRGLEFTRDASFAIAGSIAAVVAAPVVAGAVGVGGLGLTGASATIATVGGTGVVVGTGMAGVRGTSAAGGVLLAGGTLSEAGSAFTAEAWRGFREGFLSGAGGAAARSVGLAINAAGGTLAREVATRTGAEMLINGTTTMVDVLARGGSMEEAARAAVISAAQAAPGALLGGSNNPVVRNLLAPFTAGGTAYLAARANGASSGEALAQAGTAVATNVAMSRAVHTPETDTAFVERGRSIGAGVRETALSTMSGAARIADRPSVSTTTPLVPSVSVSGELMGNRPVRGATAEGMGEAFQYEYHPESPGPVVERRRLGGTGPAQTETRTRGRGEPVPDWQEQKLHSLLDDVEAHGLLSMDREVAATEMRASLAGRTDEEALEILHHWDRQVEIGTHFAEHMLPPPGDSHVDIPTQDLPVMPREPRIGPAESVASVEARTAPRIEIGPADIAALRTRYPGVGARRHTVAVSGTDVPGLEGTIFEGGSPVVRREAGLPPTEHGPVESPSGLAFERHHAEQDIANQFIAAVESRGITAAELEGRTLAIHISNPRGVCRVCRSGLNDPDAPFGVLRQLSERYPGLNIRVTVDGPPGADIGYRALFLNSGDMIWSL
jgi:Domain of unknown function (DUF4157)